MAICRAARSRVSVVLGGDGGDELLGGYTRYRTALRTVEAAARVPRWVAGGVRAVGFAAPFWLRGATRLGRFSADLDHYYTRDLWSYCPRPWPLVLKNGASRDWTDGVAAHLRADPSRTGLLRLMACDAANYLPDDILVKTDRASMAVGLELRAPLLDHRLFELVMQADPTWLSSDTRTKLPLQELYASQLPDHVFTRRKMGFGVPIRDWLHGGLEHVASERLLGRGRLVADLVDRRAVHRLLRSHRLRLRDESTRIWHLLVLDAWLQRWRPTVRGDG
jgi:asparagine synthase (glutamine-hydrolysing)